MLLSRTILLFPLALSSCFLTGGGGGVCPQEDPALHLGETETSLDADCRCLATWGIPTEYDPLCQDPAMAEDSIGGLGQGPRPQEMGARIRNGDLWEDRGEIIVAASLYGDEPGFVLGLDIETGDRRVISGTYTDPSFGTTEVGDGPMWGEPHYALRGPDDMVYVYATSTPYDPEISGKNRHNSIWRMDPDTGSRELVWQHRLKNPITDPGDCNNGDADNPGPIQLALEGGAFEVAEDGAFFIGTIRNANPAPGVGFIEVAADGSSCRFVSMNPAQGGNSWGDGVGGGFDFGLAVETINHINGELFVMDNNNLIRVDRQTGMRERLMSVGLPGIMQWDEERELFHLTSLEPPYAAGGFLATVDVAEGKWWMWSRCANIDEDHPFAENCVQGGNAEVILNNNQGWVLPDGEHMITVNGRSSFGIVDMDTAVFNHFSF